MAQTSLGHLSFYLADSLRFVTGTPWEPVVAPTKFMSLNDEERQWLRSSWSNLDWVLRYTIRLLDRVKPETAKAHEKLLRPLAEELYRSGSRFHYRQPTAFLNQTPESKDPDVHRAYCRWLQSRWKDYKRAPTWRNNGLQPAWYVTKS